MTAEQAEVVGQDVTVERLAQLSAERAAADAAGQAAEDGARYGTEGDTDWPGERTDSCASLATREGSADATRNTTHGADGGADFHGVMEGSDFGGVTARALQ
ncbi:Putative non-ribosomal peptide synthetase [Pseudomonas putida]|uniref:Putative non-ribosomal peptide synthetase n=1 Tax=Pseudomonas putida TaxID=303 RepID=A0A1L7N6W1_PSEPU|nr:Putative non-ribosomal peptide synthetase [Pseudomonas putida]